MNRLLTSQARAAPACRNGGTGSKTYIPMEEDDLLFRNGRENFEYLRDNYRIRREFGSYSVRTE
jgi:hypothetical protein